MKTNDLGPLPFINPRHQNLENAAKDVRESLLTIFRDYDLTTSERLFILSREIDFRITGCVSQEHRAMATTDAQMETVQITPATGEMETFIKA